jgi:hypothetical protein
MPCYDPETHNRPIRLEKKIHYLTELLCTLCTSVNKHSPNYLPNLEEVNKWWLKHQEFDRIGEEIEAKVKEHGVDKLTPNERSHYYARQRNDATNP